MCKFLASPLGIVSRSDVKCLSPQISLIPPSLPVKMCGKSWDNWAVQNAISLPSAANRSYSKCREGANGCLQRNCQCWTAIQITASTSNGAGSRLLRLDGPLSSSWRRFASRPSRCTPIFIGDSALTQFGARSSRPPTAISNPWRSFVWGASCPARSGPTVPRARG